MPLSESPSPQSPTALGYDPSTLLHRRTRLWFAGQSASAGRYCTSARTGRPAPPGLQSHLEQLQSTLADDPRAPGRRGKATKAGSISMAHTHWGNRIATEKTDVQNMLIDACMLLLTEYHVDGFRFDATHTNYRWIMASSSGWHGSSKTSSLMCCSFAENLPNQSDLNRERFRWHCTMV